MSRKNRKVYTIDKLVFDVVIGNKDKVIIKFLTNEYCKHCASTLIKENKCSCISCGKKNLRDSMTIIRHPKNNEVYISWYYENCTNYADYIQIGYNQFIKNMYKCGNPYEY